MLIEAIFWSLYYLSGLSCQPETLTSFINPDGKTDPVDQKSQA